MSVSDVKCHHEWMHQLVESLLTSARRAYSSKYLIYTNTATASITFIIGDFLTQRIEQFTDDEPTGWSITRTTHMGIAGCLNGFIFHHWYRTLDTMLPGTCIKTVMKKTVADIIIGSNLSIIGLFAAQAALDNSSFEQFVDDYRTGWFPVYMSDLMLWPATQFFNFFYLKPRYRLLCVNLVTIVAAVFRSHIAHVIQKGHNKDVKGSARFLLN